MVDKFDLQVHGVNSAQEHLSGIGPNVGTETCNIVDYTYSNEWLLRITGDTRVHGDRVEKAFFNAAGAAINRSFEAHVYHQVSITFGGRGSCRPLVLSLSIGSSGSLVLSLSLSSP